MLRGVLVVIVVLGTAACSDDELPDQVPDAQVHDGLAALFAGDHAGEGAAADARCFADELTDRVSTERLRGADLLDYRYRVPADIPPLPRDLAEDWVDAQFACVDFVDESARAQVAVTKGRIDTEAYAACLRGRLTDQQVRAGTVDALTGDWQGAELEALGRAQSDCAAEATPADSD